MSKLVCLQKSKSVFPNIMGLLNEGEWINVSRLYRLIMCFFTNVHSQLHKFLASSIFIKVQTTVADPEGLPNDRMRVV